MVRLLLMQRAVRFSHIGAIVITRAALAADLSVAARHTPARQEAGARRPDVLPSFFGLFREHEIFSYGEQARNDNELLILQLEAGPPVESHRHHPSVPRTVVMRHAVITTLFASSQQISRFRKIAEKEKTARDEVAITSDGGPYLTAARPWMLVVAAWQGAVGDYLDAAVRLALTAETVEFPVSDAAEKSMPLVRCEYQDWPYRVPAVPDADLATGQARHLDAVAVRVTQGALNPVTA